MGQGNTKCHVPNNPCIHKTSKRGLLTSTRVSKWNHMWGTPKRRAMKRAPQLVESNAWLQSRYIRGTEPVFSGHSMWQLLSVSRGSLLQDMPCKAPPQIVRMMMLIITRLGRCILARLIGKKCFAKEGGSLEGGNTDRRVSLGVRKMKVSKAKTCRTCMFVDPCFDKNRQHFGSVVSKHCYPSCSKPRMTFCSLMEF